MIYLKDEHLEDAITCKELMDAIEKAYAIEKTGAYSMPHRIHLNHLGNTLLYMPCFLDSVFGTKILSLFPDNPKKGLPAISGLVLLNDAHTGITLAILDGAKVTALRTGAVSGVAIRHTTPREAATVGLIGAGVQGYYQVLFACQAREIRKVKIFDQAMEKAEQLVSKLNSVLAEISIEVADSVEELVADSQVIITATPSQTPVLPEDKQLLSGKNYIAIGSYKPEMRELPRALYTQLDLLLIDTEHGLEESGDLIAPLEEGWFKREKIKVFSEYLAGTKSDRVAGETTLFKSVGMALFDIVVADTIYRKAAERGIGIPLD